MKSYIKSKYIFFNEQTTLAIETKWEGKVEGISDGYHKEVILPVPLLQGMFKHVTKNVLLLASCWNFNKQLTFSFHL